MKVPLTSGRTCCVREERGAQNRGSAENTSSTYSGAGFPAAFRNLPDTSAPRSVMVIIAPSIDSFAPTSIAMSDASAPLTIADRSSHPAGGRPLILRRYRPGGTLDMTKLPSGVTLYVYPGSGRGDK